LDSQSLKVWPIASMFLFLTKENIGKNLQNFCLGYDSEFYSLNNQRKVGNDKILNKGKKQ
jgi:hypothetical protein